MADATSLYIKVNSDGAVVASKNLKGLSKQGKDTAKAIDGTTASTERFNNATNRSATYLNRFSSGTKTVGRDISRYGLLLSAVATATVKFGFDLSQGLGQVQTLIPGTGDRIYELEEAVKSLSIESGKNFNDLTEGLYQTISAFQDTKDTVDIFNQATKAAVAGGATVADSIELASAVTKAYGDTTAEATQKVFDLAFETVRLGQTTFPQLANGIQTATDSAVRLGVSQEELFATFSALTGVIGDASEVATKFRSASASLLNPNKNLLALFAELSKQTGEVINNGEDFVRVSGGFANALTIIEKTAVKANEPLQDYIRRIEGITLTSRLAGNSTDKFTSDLQAMFEATGASERSFREVKDGIDQFRQSILESRQQIAVAATEIAQNIIPRLADLIQWIANVATWFASLDASIQSTVLNIGAFVIILGPTLIALGGLLRALQLIQALKTASTIAAITATLGPAGLLAVLGTVAISMGIVNHSFNEFYETQQKLIDITASSQGIISTFSSLTMKFEDLNEVDEVHIELNKKLIEQYPELAGSVDVYNDSLSEVYAQLVKIKQLEFKDALSGLEQEYSSLNKKSDDLVYRMGEVGKNIVTEFNRTTQGIYDPLTSIDDVFKEIESGSDIGKILQESFGGSIAQYALLSDTIEGVQLNIDDVITKAEELTTKTGLFDFTYAEGQFFVLAKSLKDVLGTMRKEINEATSPEGLDIASGDKLKTWQEWFEQITDVAKETFGNSGTKAGEEFDKQLRQIISTEAISSALFNEQDFDFAEAIGSQLDTAKSAFKELSLLKAEAIKDGDIFQVQGLNAEETDNVMKKLLETISRLTEEFNKASEIEIYQDLDKTVVETNKLAEAFPRLYDEEARQEMILKAMQKAFDDLTALGIDPTNESYKNLGDTIATFGNELDEQKEKVYGLKELWNDFKGQLGDIGMDALTQSFYEIGYAIGNSANSMKDFGQAMNNVLKSVLDALPALFIQAGLQAIISGNVPLGLGLIAAGLAGNLVAGVVAGTIAEGENNQTTQTNATGAIYSFAKGGASLGSFENSIVNTPTRFANGSGLMGEVGAEAIMPLTRMKDGNLGVQSAGGNANVTVNVINNSGEQVSTSEKTGADGSKEIEVLIGKVVQSQLDSGKYDRSMASRYGSKVKGY